MSPDPDLVVILMAVVTTLIGFPLALGVSRRLTAKSVARPTTGMPPGVDERLARIEQAVDAIAVEMERVSEGQRFTTKLLSDRSAGGSPADGPR